MNAEVMNAAAAPEETPNAPAPAAPQPRSFPFGVLGLLGLIGLFGVRKVKG
jgi:MYXO-CTERM domain-containing protein